MTLGQSRRKFARICIEVDLSKPLKPFVEVDYVAYNVVYEGISLICFECGCFGHAKDKCPFVHVTTDVDNNENGVNFVSDVNMDNVMLDTQVVQDIQTESNGTAEVLNDVIKEDMGPWMLMSNKNKRKAGGNGGGRKHAPSGSRFDVLNEEGGNESGEAEHITLIGSKGVSPPIVKLWQSFDDKMKSAVSSGKNKSFNNSITNMENATSPLVYNHLLGLTFLKPL